MSDLKSKEMKMKNILWAILAVAITVAGCAKQDAPVESKEYKIEFSVAEKNGFGPATKAVKTTWAAGDQIAIFCQPGGTGYYIADNAKLICLKFDGTSWTASSVSQELATELGTGGNFTAIHYRVTNGDNISLKTDNETFATYNGGEILICKGAYTTSAETISFGEIAMTFESNKDSGAGTQFQVSVKNLDASDGWTMGIANDSYTPSAANISSWDQLAHEGTYSGLWRLVTDMGVIGTWGGNMYTYSRSACVQNGNDISFVFMWDDDLENETKNAKYHFYLTNGTDVYTYTVDRGSYADGKYQKNLEIGHAYVLPAITEAGKWTKQN